MKRRWLALIGILALGSGASRDGCSGNHREPGARPRPSQIVLLGTGNPNADPERSGPAVAIVVGSEAYLVDCGPGVVRRAAAAERMGIRALTASNLKRVFVTHLHSDHTLGLPDLMFSPWVLEREEPLQVYGPPGIRAMVDHLQAAYAQDIRIRIDGLEQANTTGYQVEVHEILPGVVYQDANVKVRAFAVDHGSWEHAYGFRFETPDRVIVLSGDTVPSDNLIRHARGCDVLLHEVYSHEKYSGRPAKWQKYHAAFHTSTRELADLARKINPGLLILYHQLFWGATDADLVREIRETYPGPVVSGNDLDVY